MILELDVNIKTIIFFAKKIHWIVILGVSLNVPSFNINKSLVLNEASQKRRLYFIS